MRMSLTLQTWSRRREGIFNTNYLLYLVYSAVLYFKYSCFALAKWKYHTWNGMTSAGWTLLHTSSHFLSLSYVRNLLFHSP